MAPTTLLDISEVHKFYANHHVLQGVSLQVPEGTVACLLGPSGSGKSTLLRCINHLESIDAGHKFLVGVSVDGPADIHDSHRVNRAGRGSHAQVLRGWEVLQRHGVECNVLTTVNAVNGDHGMRVYRHLRDDLGARFMQFIPVVERVPEADLARAEAGWRDEEGVRLLYRQAGNAVTSRSVSGPQLGNFLVEIFDEWVRRDVGEVFVQTFDEMLGARLGRHRLCVHAPECGTALAVEANGDVYSCDHFVEPGYLLGNVHRDRYTDLLASPEQRAFGATKRTGLTAQCRSCPVRWASFFTLLDLLTR